MDKVNITAPRITQDMFPSPSLSTLQCSNPPQVLDQPPILRQSNQEGMLLLASNLKQTHTANCTSKVATRTTRHIPIMHNITTNTAIVLVSVKVAWVTIVSHCTVGLVAIYKDSWALVDRQEVRRRMLAPVVAVLPTRTINHTHRRTLGWQVVVVCRTRAKSLLNHKTKVQLDRDLRAKASIRATALEVGFLVLVVVVLVVLSKVDRRDILHILRQSTNPVIMDINPDNNHSGHRLYFPVGAPF